jgi:predicted lactoylglutathione lyase
MFYKDVGYVNNIRMSDLEEMHPFERDIYIMLMQQKLEDARTNK